MRELPILFSGQMVKAILEGRKTQTRRVIKPQPPKDAVLVELHGDDYLVEELRGKVSWFVPSAHDLWPCNREDAIKSRHQVGDRLYVRESFAYYPDPDSIVYKADCPPDALRWKPSIHMPRWASRITLEVTAVKVERLQEISREDARAEGCTEFTDDTGWYGPEVAFCNLWDSINGKTNPWGSNPWIWAYTFKRI